MSQGIGRASRSIGPVPRFGFQGLLQPVTRMSRYICSQRHETFDSHPIR